jgi:hypothetical protein
VNFAFVARYFGKWQSRSRVGTSNTNMSLSPHRAGPSVAQLSQHGHESHWIQHRPVDEICELTWRLITSPWGSYRRHLCVLHNGRWKVTINLQFRSNLEIVKWFTEENDEKPGAKQDTSLGLEGRGLAVHYLLTYPALQLATGPYKVRV